MKNDFDLIDFFLLLRKEFKLIFLTTIIFFFLSLIYLQFNNKKFNLKLVITPISISQYDKIYIEKNNLNMREIDEISRNDYTPLTIFYSFLKKIENNNKIDESETKNNYEIYWNFGLAQHEVYIKTKTKNLSEAVDDMEKFVILNENLLKNEIVSNLERQKSFIKNEYERSIIEKNILTLKDARLVNYKFTNINGSHLSKKIFFSIFIFAGFFLGIVIALIKKGISEKNN
tara:strand:- start:113 stop:802 length:690 start_codon:yes stop_codon:yes gene_type:complete